MMLLNVIIMSYYACFKAFFLLKYHERSYEQHIIKWCMYIYQHRLRMGNDMCIGVGIVIGFHTDMDIGIGLGDIDIENQIDIGTCLG